jgi:hypothetical protein
VIELSPEFENLAGAAIGREACYQYPSILPQVDTSFLPAKTDTESACRIFSEFIYKLVTSLTARGTEPLIQLSNSSKAYP